MNYKPGTRGKAWKLAFLGESGGYIVIRGLRFFIGEEEYYPPARVSYASV